MNRYILNQALARMDADFSTLQKAATIERMRKGKIPMPESRSEEYDSCMFSIVKLLTDSCFHKAADRPWMEHSDVNNEEVRVAEAILRLMAYASAKELDVVSAIREIFLLEDWD